DYLGVAGSRVRAEYSGSGNSHCRRDGGIAHRLALANRPDRTETQMAPNLCAENELGARVDAECQLVVLPQPMHRLRRASSNGRSPLLTAWRRRPASIKYGRTANAR